MDEPLCNAATAIAGRFSRNVGWLKHTDRSTFYVGRQAICGFYSFKFVGAARLSVQLGYRRSLMLRHIAVPSNS